MTWPPMPAARFCGRCHLPKEVYVLEGSEIRSKSDFYRAFGNAVMGTPNFPENLDWLNDVLQGGHGTPDEGFIIRWKNSEASRNALGQETFEKFVEVLEDNDRRRPGIAINMPREPGGKPEYIFGEVTHVIELILD